MQPFLKTASWLWLIGAAFVLAKPATANLLKGTLDGEIVRKSGQGQTSLTYSFKTSNDFFDGSGNLTETNLQKFVDHEWNVHLDYGVTDKLTFAIDLPIKYRFENRLLDADDFGLGDVELTILYKIIELTNFPLESALTLTTQFPSGDSDIQLLNLASSPNNDLPLGSGQINLFLGLQFRHKWHNFYLREELGFKLRFDDLVEYQQAFQQDIDPTSGLPFAQAVGNLRVDYGNEFIYQLDAAYRFLRNYAVGLTTHLRHYLRGDIEVFDIDNTTISKSSANLPAGYLWTLTPNIRATFYDHLTATFGATIPVMGEDVPVISLVESLVGIKYWVSISYAY